MRVKCCLGKQELNLRSEDCDAGHCELLSTHFVDTFSARTCALSSNDAKLTVMSWRALKQKRVRRPRSDDERAEMKDAICPLPCRVPVRKMRGQWCWRKGHVRDRAPPVVGHGTDASWDKGHV
jgi:hypothetical protein